MPVYRFTAIVVLSETWAAIAREIIIGRLGFRIPRWSDIFLSFSFNSIRISRYNNFSVRYNFLRFIFLSSFFAWNNSKWKRIVEKNNFCRSIRMEIIGRNIYEDHYAFSFHARFVFVGLITFYLVVAKRFANFSDFIWYITHPRSDRVFLGRNVSSILLLSRRTCLYKRKIDRKKCLIFFVRCARTMDIETFYCKPPIVSNIVSTQDFFVTDKTREKAIHAMKDETLEATLTGEFF